MQLATAEAISSRDRDQRREDLIEIGGHAGVLEIRRRIGAAHKAKSILCGAEIPGEVLSSLLSRSEAGR